MTDWKVGDLAKFIFAQPGNDTTIVQITRVDNGTCAAWDLFFGFDVNDIKLEKLIPFDVAAAMDEVQMQRCSADGMERLTLRDLLARVPAKVPVNENADT